jgi:hypothetical protein
MKEKIKDLAVDYGEIILDSELPEGVLQEIPFLKSIYNLGKITSSVPEMIFAAKVRRFLTAVDLYTKKNELKESIESDPKKQDWLVEVTTLSLNQADRLEKCELLGVIFIALLDGLINEDEYSGLCHATLKSDITVLKAFATATREFTQKNGKLLRIGYESLIASNLARGTGTASPDASGTFTRPTELGLVFVKIVDKYLSDNKSW